jgi:hypothetical protein
VKARKGRTGTRGRLVGELGGLIPVNFEKRYGLSEVLAFPLDRVERYLSRNPFAISRVQSGCLKLLQDDFGALREIHL